MLFDKLKKDRIQAMKDGKKSVSGLLGVVIGDSSKNDKDPSDDVVLATIKSFLKKIDEVLQAVECGSPDYQKYYAEKEILDAYLPQQLSIEGLRTAVKYAVEFDGATNMGAVMKYLVANHKDRYDGKLASQMAKEILNVK